MSDLRPPERRRRLPDLYSLDEIAASFGLSRKTIARRALSGEFGKVIRFGDGRVRVSFSAVEEFLQRHECAASAAAELESEPGGEDEVK